MKITAITSRFLPALFTLLYCMYVQTPFAQPLVENVEIQSTYETWRLPENESMGIFSLGVKKRFGDYASFGVDFYDAIEGQRGGFITLGMSGAVEYPISNRWLVEAGLHLGAGGGNGGYLLTGGGLMLRESLGMKYAMTKLDAVSLGWSHVDFPEGGKIQSNQFYISYIRGFKGIFQDGQPIFATREVRDTLWNDYEPGYQQPALILRNVAVPASTRQLGGSPQRNLQQVGIEWKSYLEPHTFFRMETVGAMGGGSAGYMHVMAGFGAEYALTESLTAEVSLNLGGGGGGAVDTAGGLLTEVAMGVRQDVFDDWFVKVLVGRVSAPNGQYSGTGYMVGLGRDFGALSRPRSESNSLVLLDSQPIRIRATQQTYSGHDSTWRNRPEKNVNNLGVQLDYFISPSLFLTGQGLAAYAGDAGAYMTGLVGVGYKLALNDHLFAEGEALVGAAGGGGLTVGSGLVNQINFSIGYQLSDSLSLMGTIGEMQAANGPFRARAVGISLAYNFNVLSIAN